MLTLKKEFTFVTVYGYSPKSSWQSIWIGVKKCPQV